MILKKLRLVGVVTFAVFTVFENSNATTYTFDVDSSSGIGTGSFSIDLPDAWPPVFNQSTVMPASSFSGTSAAGDAWGSLSITLNQFLEKANNVVISGSSTSGSAFSGPTSAAGLSPVEAVSALPGVTLHAVPSGEVPNQLPTITCPAPATLQGNNGAVATVSVHVDDADGDPLVVFWTVDGVTYQGDSVPAGSPNTEATVEFTASFGLGQHNIQVTVTDGKSGSASCSTTIVVQKTSRSKRSKG